MLPTPSSERWKPLRAGLVDMFYYDQEEFWFHDGRLLLRGNNGTGKSKVLALTLPFLLDGDLAPHRVEPDGDRQKRMEWNLLLGGRHPSPERLGYTWLEFGRRTADGTEEFRTIGCGLKAVTGRGIARHWFFLTSQRPGAELQLLPDSRVPLTREKLREQIGQHGFVYDRAADYRRAVDEHLFGLGPHRYEALVNLLVQLRQPQLSKKPDEKLLSRALTEALPPLSPGLVTTVAEAFRGLDDERDALRSLAEAQEAATAFLGHYRRYAKVAAKRKAARPRLTQSRYEGLGRDLAAAEEAFTAAQQQLDEAQRELTQLEEQRTELEARQKRAGGRSRRCATRSGSSSSARTPTARRKRRRSKRLTGTGTPATSRGTPTRRPRQRTGPAPDETSSPWRCARPRPRQPTHAAPSSTRQRSRHSTARTSEARTRMPPRQPNGPTASSTRSLPTWMPPRRSGRHSGPGPSAKPRPSPTGKCRPSRSWTGCSPTSPSRAGNYRPRRKRKAGCRLRSRPRRNESRPRSSR